MIKEELHNETLALRRDRMVHEKEMHRKIDRAYERRRIVHPQEILEEARQINQLLLGLSDEDVIDIPFERPPYQADIVNPYQYPKFLDYCYLTASPFLGKEDRKDLVKENLAHEFHHHVPGLNQPDVTIHFAARFLQHAVTGQIVTVPLIHIEGPIKVEVYRKMLHSPENPSSFDLAVLGEKI